jgi:hypothetical protein
MKLQQQQRGGGGGDRNSQILIAARNPPYLMEPENVMFGTQAQSKNLFFCIYFFYKSLLRRDLVRTTQQQ